MNYGIIILQIVISKLPVSSAPVDKELPVTNAPNIAI